MVRKKLSIFMVFVMIFSLFSTSGALAITNSTEDKDESLHLKFDFGSASSPVADGYLQVTNTMVYNEDRGYGLDREVDSRNRTGPDDVRRDFTISGSNYEFKVDLPNGNYELLIISGDDIAQNRTGFIIEGEDKGNFHVGSGDFIEYKEIVTVEDEQLNIVVTNDRRINGIEIVQVTDGGTEPTEPDAPPFLLFDFGNGPVAEGYLQVTNNMIYNSERGYGINKTVAERDRGAPDDLRRDFLIDGNFEFMVDLPNGDYFIRIFAGDNIAFNRSSFIVEGEHLGSFTSNSGQFATITHTTTVSDGQLNIRMGDNGRINGLQIMPVAQIDSLEVSKLSFSPETYVGLSWDPEKSAVSYNVHRKEEGQGSFTLLGNTSETSFIDDTVELGTTYTYVVTFLTDLGIESAFSNEVVVSVSDDTVPAPVSPSELTIEELLVEEQVTFSWNESDDALLYYVYRTRYNPEHFSNGEVFERVGVTRETTFTDEDIFSTNPYYYIVRAVNEGGISEASEVLVVQEREKSEKFYGKGPFHAQVLQTGDKWRVINRGVVYVGDNMLDAMQAAVDSLTPGRTTQEKVIVRGSGTIPANRSLDLPSHTSFEVDGTIHVEGNDESFSYGNHNAAVRIRHAKNVSIPKLNVTGSPNFGVFVRTSENIHLGQIDLRLDAGLGIRIDSRDNDNVYGVRNVRIDDVYVSGTSAHGVETYGVDGISIGTVTAVNTGYSGVLLNDTINASVDIVYGYGAGTGTGYATFRMANRNGHIDDDYSHNIFVGEVIARGGGRGIFSVSRSGGAVIERVDLARTGGNAMLIENSYNISINGGVVEGPSGIRIAARNDMPNTRDILMKNLTLRNSEIVESPCGDNVVFENITLENNSTMNVCRP
ncbi:fibronectin type 3 domain-containing protein [Evansella vedderi]|uniref:Fibronectin type 3 domain-containing protein n=1 Tax=Evansella vedderi TaxID=38282 RepID=A0ABT9ZQR7_9BACI|nr:hypothetical protein [Evansella vedderi]MDQ0253194.1 fibronectin type 3 domain-containing protein [Evansella vedderi]